jgi:carbon monoxide dehydrogenase subunit G
MEMSGTLSIAAPRAAVWTALNDPAVLSQCIEGCESLTRLEDGRLEGVVQAKVGPVKAKFSGLVTLGDVVEGESYTLSGEGKGGVAGFAKGRADVRLADAEGGTALSYDVKATVGGKLAQLGARLIDAAAKSYADEFFSRFKAIVETPAVADVAETAAEPAPTPTVATPAPAPQPAEPTAAGLPSWVWVGGIVIAVALLIAALLMA